MNWISLLSIPIAYLLGSIPSAYIVARCSSGVDIRDESDGRISAAAVYRRVGILSFMFTVALDIGKAALSVLVAQWLNAIPEIVLLAGVVTISGHQWSMFLKFQGGLGATTIGGVLLGIVTVPTIIGAVIAAIVMWMTKKSTFSFVIGVLIIAVILFAINYSDVIPPPIFLIFPPPLLLVCYPVILTLMMVLKVIQIKYRPGVPLKV